MQGKLPKRLTWLSVMVETDGRFTPWFLKGSQQEIRLRLNPVASQQVLIWKQNGYRNSRSTLAIRTLS